MFINKYTLEGAFICAYRSKILCADDNNIPMNSLTNVLAERGNSIAGRRYKQVSKFNTRNLRALKPAIVKASFRNKVVRTATGHEFKSISECAKHFGVHYSTISKMLSGTRTNTLQISY